MRFLVLSQYFPPEIGAPQVRLAALIRELLHLGQLVEVVTALPNYPTGRFYPGYRRRFYLHETWEDVPVHRVWLYPAMGAGFRRVLNYATFTFTSMVGLCRAAKPDFVFVESPPLFLSVPGYLAARAWRVPMIFNVADLWPDAVRELGLMGDGPALGLARGLEAWTYKHATYVNGVTEGVCRRLVTIKCVPLEKVLFLPNGVDTTLFAPREPDVSLAAELELRSRPVFLYTGTLGYAQGLEVVLEACKLLAREGVLLVFVGDGSEKPRLREKVLRDGLDWVVRFLEPAPPEYITRLYSVAAGGIVSLRNLPLFEGTRPSKVLTIMACGKPVLYSGTGEGARLVQEAQAGIVVPPGDPAALADAVLRLLRNPAEAKRLGENGRKYVEEHATWAIVVRRWLKDLKERTAGERRHNGPAYETIPHH